MFKFFILLILFPLISNAQGWYNYQRPPPQTSLERNHPPPTYGHDSYFDYEHHTPTYPAYRRPTYRSPRYPVYTQPTPRPLRCFVDAQGYLRCS